MENVAKPVYAWLFRDAQFTGDHRHSGDTSTSFLVKLVKLEGRKVRNIPDREAEADLMLRVHVMRGYNADQTPEASVELEWREPFSIDFVRVAKMAKLATTIRRKLDKADDRYGTAQGAYAEFLRLSDALGVKRAVRYETTVPGMMQSSYDDNDFQHGDQHDGARWLVHATNVIGETLSRREAA